VVLVIDTSSVRAGVAVLDGTRVVAEDVRESSRDLRLETVARSLANLRELTAVAVARGPGSFTGVRLGASFGVGLAMALGIPLLGLGTLQLAAARAREPSTGVSEAGRGRLYHQAPDGGHALGLPADLPAGRPATGWLREATAAAVRAAGVRLLEEGELRSFGEGAARALGGAQELGYNMVKLEYVRSFEPLL